MKINNRQKIILIGVVVIVILILLFPPFQYRFGTGVIKNLGYSFILSPPPVDKSLWPAYSPLGSVNKALLAKQCIGIILAGVIVFFSFKDR